jgi:hypothetical protein
MAQCWEQVPPEFGITLRDGETGTGGNFWISCAASQHICTAQVITKHKLHVSCNVPRNRLKVKFRLRHGSPTCGHKPADAHHFIFFHMRPTNQQPTIRGVDFSHKNIGRPWFTETRVIRYQPFVSVHNAPFHSECNTNDKSSNNICENIIIPPTNIQYLKINVRNWIRSQTSQWYTNRMKWTWGDKLHPTAVRTTLLHKQANNYGGFVIHRHP